MSGLLALLDDVAGIAKVAAASIDDVAAQAAKAGMKAAGAVIDDAAVTPKYVHGFEASRELPIIWRIAKGSIRNKLLILLPVALLLSSFAPWAIAPLLMLGGAYLCFEGAEKVLHVWSPHHVSARSKRVEPQDPAKLEEEKSRGAIKTDFILSAEIMTIALSAIPPGNVFFTGATLAVVAVGITVAVYGAVALIVKADDVGLRLAQSGGSEAVQALGRAIVRAMPKFMTGLTIVGTAAMLWVGGSIVVHALEEMGIAGPAHVIHAIAHSVAHVADPQFQDAVAWVVTAAIDGVLGLALGFGLIPVVEKVIEPVVVAVSGKPADPH